MRAGVALGSNLGERLANLRNARKEIAAMSGTLPPLRCSAIYETEPVECEKAAAKFFNAVIEFGYAGQPIELRRELAVIERVLGRPAAHQRNVSRPIDLDLLYFGDVIIETAELLLLHPRAAPGGVRRALLVRGLPIHTYEDPSQASASGRALMEAGAQAVKLQGGGRHVAQIKASIAEGIPVMGHLGMLPQSVRQE